MIVTEEMRLEKAHVQLMKHPETSLYTGIFLMGTSTISDEAPTAYTDGFNKVYGRRFVKNLSDAELRALIMHENLHVALKHMSRFDAEFKDDPQLVNMGTDYAVNDIIVNVKDEGFLVLPKGGLVDKKYHLWSANEIIRDLKQKKDKDPDFQPQDSMDDHGFGEGESSDMTREKADKMSREIDQKLREGGMFASKQGGGGLPKQLRDVIEGKVDWKAILSEFVTSHIKGKDEYTFRKFDKRRIMDEIYLPSKTNESIERLLIEWDTSGSIGNEANSAFLGHLSSICNMLNPDEVVIHWWDTEVAGEQVFTKGHYDNMAKLLKPKGGGGTDPNCIPKYLKDKNIDATCMVVFTDGYFWGEVNWDTNIPTLWLVTENEKLKVPKGKIVKQCL
jgi:predicted metal-dependent peptidase